MDQRNELVNVNNTSKSSAASSVSVNLDDDPTSYLTSEDVRYYRRHRTIKSRPSSDTRITTEEDDIIARHKLEQLHGEAAAFYHNNNDRDDDPTNYGMRESVRNELLRGAMMEGDHKMLSFFGLGDDSARTQSSSSSSSSVRSSAATDNKNKKKDGVSEVGKNGDSRKKQKEAKQKSDEKDESGGGMFDWMFGGGEDKEEGPKTGSPERSSQANKQKSKKTAKEDEKQASKTKSAEEEARLKKSKRTKEETADEDKNKKTIRDRNSVKKDVVNTTEKKEDVKQKESSWRDTAAERTRHQESRNQREIRRSGPMIEKLSSKDNAPTTKNEPSSEKKMTTKTIVRDGEEASDQKVPPSEEKVYCSDTF